MLDENAICYYIEAILKFPVFCLDGENNPAECGRSHDESVLAHLQMLKQEDYRILRSSPVYLHHTEDNLFWGSVSANGKLYLAGPAGFDLPGAGARAYLTDYVSFINALLMLYESLTGTRMSLMEFLMQNDEFQKWDRMISERRSTFFSDQQENEAMHNSYAQERREQQAIRDGNLERFERAISEPIQGNVGNIRLENIRVLKDLAIAVYTLSTRSAMDGGLNYEEGFSLSDIFFEQVERKKTAQELFHFLRFAQRDLVLRVAEAKKKNRRSSGETDLQKPEQDHPGHPLVEEAKIYIDQHIRGDTSAAAIARHLGVSENYLSRLFSRHESTGLKQYILLRKIENACMLLIYSDLTCDEIAYYYDFSSSSHFGKTFRRITGQTPAQYRLKNKSRQKEESTAENRTEK